MISLPNYGELSNWWRSHERKLLHERVIDCTNHLGECDINFHWAETLAVMSPFVAVPLATMSRVITAPLPLYFLSYFQERKLAPVNQRPPTLWNRGKLIRFPPTRRRGGRGRRGGYLWNFLIILPDIHRKLEKLSRLISAGIEIDAPPQSFFRRLLGRCF